MPDEELGGFDAAVAKFITAKLAIQTEVEFNWDAGRHMIRIDLLLDDKVISTDWVPTP